MISDLCLLSLLTNIYMMIYSDVHQHAILDS